MDELSTRGEESLRILFEDLVWRHFFEDIGLEEPQIAHYVSRLLADFASIDHLYRVTGVSGRRLEQVGEMLIASNPVLEASSFDQERAVRKHVGDFTLFMSGLFPDSLTETPRQHLDASIDFVQAGKESYAIVSSFDQWEYREEAPLFRSLSDNFELCVAGLHFVKHDLEEFQHEAYDRLEMGRLQKGIDESLGAEDDEGR